MNRNVEELPVVEISSTSIFDPVSITSGERIDINVEVQGDTAGYVSLDDPSDLCILRDAIDAYIRKYNIKPFNLSNDDNNK
ncbi:hypothetical protein [uncultured Duncaniella sp.]|uniref:hypothetical protein n=1 Tax=uncultured Duncaniella sp. TaxID=2768039 RepID=UPI0026768579|nr:hypothetical protein [uncultured Duncaniella sp.]MCI9173286.1 hypothetical protein [Muribaculaceae bacterium]